MEAYYRKHSETLRTSLIQLCFQTTLVTDNCFSSHALLKSAQLDTSLDLSHRKTLAARLR